MLLIYSFEYSFIYFFFFELFGMNDCNLCKQNNIEIKSNDIYVYHALISYGLFPDIAYQKKNIRSF